MSGQRDAFYFVTIVAAGVLVSLLLLPLAALLLDAPFGRFFGVLSEPDVLRAIGLSAWTSFVSLGIILILGTPAAFWLSRSTSRWAEWIGLLSLLPLVLPPAVAGLALLRTFAAGGLLAKLPGYDGQLAFTGAAVVIAQVFVASPIYLRGATAAFRQVPEAIELATVTLGATPWRAFAYVLMPHALPSLGAAAALSWARALGEFGATLLFAGNVPGLTQTMPTAIYVLLEREGGAADVLSVILLLLAVAVLGAAHWLARRTRSQPAGSL